MGRWAFLLGSCLTACLSLEEPVQKGKPDAGDTDGSVEGGFFPDGSSGGGGAAGESGTEAGTCVNGADCSGCTGCLKGCVCMGGDAVECKAQCGGGGASGGAPP